MVRDEFAAVRLYEPEQRELHPDYTCAAMQMSILLLRCTPASALKRRDLS